MRVTTENQVIEVHDLSPDGRWIAFDSDRRGTMAIYRMDLDEGLPTLVIEAGSLALQLGMSVSGLHH